MIESHFESSMNVQFAAKNTFLNHFGKKDGDENFVDYSPYSADRDADEEPYKATCWGAVRYGLQMYELGQT